MEVLNLLDLALCQTLVYDILHYIKKIILIYFLYANIIAIHVR